jgi:S-formylglutathione hydrolase
MVYLPPSYEDSEKNYPTLYFLTGLSAEVDITFNGRVKGFKLNESLDSLIDNGSINEMIVVVATSKVNILNSGVRMCTFYNNSIINGNWEDYIVNDLVQFIENKYRTKKENFAQGIAGHSIGGYGAIRIGLSHPDIFGYAYSMSFGMLNPSKYGEPVFLTSSERNHELYNLINEISELPYNDALTKFGDGVIDRGLLFVPIAYATSFSNLPDLKPPFIKMPLMIVNDSLQIDYSNYFDWHLNGYGIIDSLVNNHSKNQVQINEIVMEIGTHDSDFFINGCNYTSSLLIKNKIKHQLIFNNSSHSGEFQKRIEFYMLPYFSKRLEMESSNMMYYP